MKSKHISHIYSLKEGIENLSVFPEWTWIYAESELESVTYETTCYILTENSRDFTDEENDKREEELGENGLEILFSKQQLEDILANAKQRDLNEDKIEESIDYYVFNDAFLPEWTNESEQGSGGNVG